MPLALRAFVDSSGGESLFGELFAMSTLSLVPVFIVFLAFQRLIRSGDGCPGLQPSIEQLTGMALCSEKTMEVVGV